MDSIREAFLAFANNIQENGVVGCLLG